MAKKRKATCLVQSKVGLDFRSPDDDAWYSVRLLKVREGLLRVMYVDFPEDSDDWYSHDQFKCMDEIDELLGRFRSPAEQLQDSQCGEITPGMVIVASHTFKDGKILFFDAIVDSVCRSVHKSDSTSEEQLCTCQFHVTWRHGPSTGKHATVRTENICLIHNSPVDHPVLQDFIVSARKSLEDQECNITNQDGNVSLSRAASGRGASPHPTDEPMLTCLKCPDSSHHNKEIAQSEEVTQALDDSKEVSTEMAFTGMTSGQNGCYFFWVDNVERDTAPFQIVNFLKRELSVSSQVLLFPDLFLRNTNSAAIYVESKEHGLLVLRFLNNPDIIIVSKKGRPWVLNKKCCGTYHFPMPYQGMNLGTGNQDDVTGIRVLRPGSEGYEEASKMRDLYKVHSDQIEKLQGILRRKELKVM